MNQDRVDHKDHVVDRVTKDRKVQVAREESPVHQDQPDLLVPRDLLDRLESEVPRDLKDPVELTVPLV